MVSDKEQEFPEVPDDSPEYWTRKTELRKKGVKLFTQTIYRDWCKSCGICSSFCPTKVFDRDEGGKAVAARPDDCTGCRFCELHCPDFAITITERYPDRRKEER
jgi:2-oxoglutarate ferredoxin oxidoreductase subunit delta